MNILRFTDYIGNAVYYASYTMANNIFFLIKDNFTLYRVFFYKKEDNASKNFHIKIMDRKGIIYSFGNF